MKIVYRVDGEAINCENEQYDIMIKAGFLKEAPEVEKKDKKDKIKKDKEEKKEEKKAEKKEEAESKNKLAINKISK